MQCAGRGWGPTHASSRGGRWLLGCEEPVHPAQISGARRTDPPIGVGNIRGLSRSGSDVHLLAPLLLLFAADAERRHGAGLQPLEADPLAALLADAELLFVDLLQRLVDLAEQEPLTVAQAQDERRGQMVGVYPGPAQGQYRIRLMSGVGKPEGKEIKLPNCLAVAQGGVSAAWGDGHLAEAVLNSASGVAKSAVCVSVMKCM